METCSTVPDTHPFSLNFHCAAEFPGAPNLTAAAVAQGLNWAPVSLQSVYVDSYTLSQISTSTTAVLNLSVNAELGVSGSLADVTEDVSGSRRRSLLATSTSKDLTCNHSLVASVTCLTRLEICCLVVAHMLVFAVGNFHIASPIIMAVVLTTLTSCSVEVRLASSGLPLFARTLHSHLAWLFSAHN